MLFLFTLSLIRYVTEEGRTFTSMAAFKKFAQTESTDTMDIETKEEMLWNAPNTICRQYGTDIECKCDFLEELSGGILEDLGVDIPGITSPYAYLGTYGSHFSWPGSDGILVPDPTRSFF